MDGFGLMNGFLTGIESYRRKIYQTHAARHVAGVVGSRDPFYVGALIGVARLIFSSRSAVCLRIGLKSRSHLRAPSLRKQLLENSYKNGVKILSNFEIDGFFACATVIDHS